MSDLKNQTSIFKTMGGVIRELNPQSPAEIELVATRMRQTLIEVVGEEKGGGMYTMEWLRDRVLWHLDSTKTTSKVLLAEDPHGHIAGHALARIEVADDKTDYGYFATVFVEPTYRRKGIATDFMAQIEKWFVSKNMPKIIYNTAETNGRLIRLFKRHGFVITLFHSEMVQLTKML